MTADDVKRILVVGAGQMGAQIAMQSALHGYQITLNDLSMDLLQKGMAGNRKQLERRVQKNQMTKDQMEEAIGRVRLEPDLEKAGRDARYDYLYTAEELRPWAERTRELAAAPEVEDVYVVTNNHFEGQAVANAAMLAAMVEGRTVEVPPELAARYAEALAPFAVPEPAQQRPLL